MKNSAEVVIVGGGIVGLSIAYHLAKRGMTDIVVLEKENMCGTGSTGRCAGGFRHQFSTEVNIKLSLLSVRMLETFSEEMDQAIDFHQDGYLFLLKDPKDVDVFERNSQLQRSLGIPVPDIEAPEHRLYELLAQADSDAAHSQYNALIRRLVSFERALECESERTATG